jgi:AAA15 family ATPase/GTPase
MIVDFSVENFRSIQAEQTLSMNVEGGRARLPNNYTLTEGEKLAVVLLQFLGQMRQVRQTYCARLPR